MEQRRLFESNVVSFAEFSARRTEAAAGDRPHDPWPLARRPMTKRAIAHQARMLAHLLQQASAARARHFDAAGN